MRIGVVALQGGFALHMTALARLGHAPFEVRSAPDLSNAEGIVLPGGESTAQRRLMAHLVEALQHRVGSGVPVLATCAGLVLAAKRIRTHDGEQLGFGWLDVTIARNAWGRQVDSFEALDDRGELPLVCIRAPRILEVGPHVSVLATLAGEPVLVRQSRVVGATFHPELTSSDRVVVAAFGTA